nr:ribonuclease H-like domain-containing protein [Tanacetum cinerariifolium]
MKARETLLMELLNKDQLKFHSYQDAKLLMEAIGKLCGGNKESKKVQRTLLKQQYKNFAASSLETLDQTFDRLQKLISQLELQGEVIEQEDINLKLAPKNQENKGKEYGRQTVPVENPTQNALIAQDRIREKERDELKLTLKKYQNSSKSLNTLLESQVNDKVKTGLGYKAASPVEKSFVKSSKMLENQENVKSRSDKRYHAVPPPYTGNYIPPKPDLMFIDDQVKSESVDVVSTISSSDVKTVESKVESVDKGVCSIIETKHVMKNNFSPPIIKDWISDDECKAEFEPKVKDKIVRPNIEKINFVKTATEIEEKVEIPKQHKHYPIWKQRNWNNLMSQRLGSNFKLINKACYVCGNFEHIYYDYDKRVVRPV